MKPLPELWRPPLLAIHTVDMQLHCTTCGLLNKVIVHRWCGLCWSWSGYFFFLDYFSTEWIETFFKNVVSLNRLFSIYKCTVLFLKACLCITNRYVYLKPIQWSITAMNLLIGKTIAKWCSITIGKTGMSLESLSLHKIVPGVINKRQLN